MLAMYFFFNDTATTEIYTLSLHDALPIWSCTARPSPRRRTATPTASTLWCSRSTTASPRSEEHTSELQSRQYLVCRLLLEKKETGRTQGDRVKRGEFRTRHDHDRPAVRMI